MDARGAGQVCSMTILVEDFDTTFLVHLLSPSDLIMLFWSRSFCVTQVWNVWLSGLPSRAFIDASSSARFSGVNCASTSAGIGLPFVTVMTFISQAPGLALKESAAKPQE